MRFKNKIKLKKKEKIGGRSSEGSSLRSNLKAEEWTSRGKTRAELLKDWKVCLGTRLLSTVFFTFQQIPYYGYCLEMMLRNKAMYIKHGMCFWNIANPQLMFTIIMLIGS